MYVHPPVFVCVCVCGYIIVHMVKYIETKGKKSRMTDLMICVCVCETRMLVSLEKWKNILLLLR